MDQQEHDKELRQQQETDSAMNREPVENQAKIGDQSITLSHDILTGNQLAILDRLDDILLQLKGISQTAELIRKALDELLVVESGVKNYIESIGNEAKSDEAKSDEPEPS